MSQGSPPDQCPGSKPLLTGTAGRGGSQRTPSRLHLGAWSTWWPRLRTALEDICCPWAERDCVNRHDWLFLGLNSCSPGARRGRAVVCVSPGTGPRGHVYKAVSRSAGCLPPACTEDADGARGPSGVVLPSCFVSFYCKHLGFSTGRFLCQARLAQNILEAPRRRHQQEQPSAMLMRTEAEMLDPGPLRRKEADTCSPLSPWAARSAPRSPLRGLLLSTHSMDSYKWASFSDLFIDFHIRIHKSENFFCPVIYSFFSLKIWYL